MSDSTRNNASPGTEPASQTPNVAQDNTNPSDEPHQAAANAAEDGATTGIEPVSPAANSASDSATPTSEPASPATSAAADGAGAGSHVVGAFQVNSVTTGTITAGGGVAVGSNITQTTVVYEGDTQYEVDISLPDPYPGLRSYSVDEANKYAGRDRDIARAVAQLTNPANPQTLLFITGVAGCGKSSFTQAGLLPALTVHYKQFGTTVRSELFSPLNQPFAQMAAALGRMFTVPPPDAEAISSPAALFNFIAAQHKDQPEVNVLIIDQFEELSTQSPSHLRDVFLTLLTSLPPFKQSKTHIIVTLRDDYLPIFADNQQILNLAQQGIKLGAMDPDGLQQAIARPLQQLTAPKVPKLDPKFRQRLADDTAADASYLPFLQATLQQMWQSGSLNPVNYSSLTDAIEKQANVVYQRHDQASQQTILDLFLNLVGVVPDKNFPPARISRARRDLVKDSPNRKQIVDELVAADLLTATTNAATGDAQIAIIHDSLLDNWATLRDAIEAKRPQLANRGRFEDALASWVQNGKSDSYLLPDAQLAAARELAAASDICMASSEASDFLQRSQAVQQERMAQQQEQAHRAIELKQKQRQLWITRIFSAIALMLLVITVVASRIAQQNADIAKSFFLANASRNQLTVNPELALLLAYESAVRDDNELSASALSDALAQTSATITLTGHTNYVKSGVFSPKGDRILTASYDKTARLWDTAGKPLAVFLHKDVVYRAVFSPDDNHILTASWDRTARLWDDKGNPEAVFTHTDQVYSAVFSPDGKQILTASADGTARLWTLAGAPLAVLTMTNKEVVNTAEFNKDGSLIVTASRDKTARLWDISGALHATYTHSDSVKSAVFSPDGQRILTASDDGNARLWNLDGTLVATLGHEGAVSRAVFSADGSRILTVSLDKTARLWNADGKLIDVLSGHTREARSPMFSADGNYMLASSYDGTFLLWDKDGKLLATITGYGLGFSPDGRRVLVGPSQEVPSGLTTNRVQLRLTHTSDMLAVAACQVHRGLTAAEVKQFNVGTARFDFSKRICPAPVSGAQP